MIKTLIGIRLSSLFSALSGKNKDGSVKKRSTARIVLMALLYGYLALTFLGIFTLFALSFAPPLIGLGLDWLYFGLFTVIAFSVVFIFSIFETKSELFECRDNELLLSMPINPRHIVISRIFTVLIYNYIETLFVMLPAITVYLAFGGKAVYLIGSLAVTLSLPLLATSLASAVGYLVALIMKRIKKNSFVTTAVSLLFLGLYLWGYSFLMGASDEETVDFVKLAEDLAFLKYIGLSATLHPIFTPLFIALSALAAYIAYRLISHSYIAIVTDNSAAARTKYVARHTNRKSALWSLSLKELRKLLSSPTYMLNSAIGLVFSLLLSVFALIRRDDISEVVNLVGNELGGSDISGIVANLMIAALIFCNSMTTISCCALSLEGKSFWILRSMPIPGRTVLLAKSMPHILLSSAVSFVCSILVMIASSAPASYWAFFILTPILANIFSALLGISLNVAFPKFSFENEAQPIKQSLPVFLVMLIMTVYSLVLIGLSLVVSIFIHPILSAFISFFITLALAISAMLILLGLCVRKYDGMAA